MKIIMVIESQDLITYIFKFYFVFCFASNNFRNMSHIKYLARSLRSSEERAM